MSGLRLGDLVLDPRRAIFVSSLRALVCADLHSALRIGIAGGLRGILKRVDGLIADYNPEFFVILGPLAAPSIASLESALCGMARRWGKRTKLQLVASEPDNDVRAMAETLGCEVHNELIWGRYRFVEKETQKVELKLMTILGEPRYAIKVGSKPFGGMKLSVFLKGFGRLTIPSMDPNAAVSSVFHPGLERCDVFAAGYQRVLPLGKVADLKPYNGIGRGLPITKATLGAKRFTVKEPTAN